MTRCRHRRAWTRIARTSRGDDGRGNPLANKKKSAGARRKRTTAPAKGAAEIRRAAQRYGKRAIEKLWEIGEGAESDSARIAALKEILDRGYGKDRNIATETSEMVIRRIERIIVDPKN
jgi:hypothetical protein